MKQSCLFPWALLLPAEQWTVKECCPLPGPTDQLPHWGLPPAWYHWLSREYVLHLYSGAVGPTGHCHQQLGTKETCCDNLAFPAAAWPTTAGPLPLPLGPLPELLCFSLSSTIGYLHFMVPIVLLGASPQYYRECVSLGMPYLNDENIALHISKYFYKTLLNRIYTLGLKYWKLSISFFKNKC